MAQLKHVLKDQYLVREGDTPSEMYIIKSGTFAVTQFRGNSELRYKDFQSGEMFGEIGLFDKKSSEVNIKALQDSEVIVMPFETLHKQIEVLPTWIQALFKNLINHLQQSISFIHNNSAADNTTTPSAHLLTKYLAILNLTSLRYNGRFSLAALRNYTIQVFQEPTARMNTLALALVELGYLQQDNTDEGPGFKNLKPETLTRFLDWYNDWLFKPDRARMQLLTEDEVKNLQAILQYAKELPVGNRGFTKVNLNNLQTESEAKTGRHLRKEDVNVLAIKKYFGAPTMEDSGVVIYLPCDELTVLAENCFLVNTLTKIFS